MSQHPLNKNYRWMPIGIVRPADISSEETMQLGCWIAVIALFSLFTGLLAIGSAACYTILGEVNARSSADQQIGMFGANTKLFLIVRRHAQLFPDSRHRRLMWGCTIAGFVFFLCHPFLWRSHVTCRALNLFR
jgi:hypothetical protein